MKQNKICVYTIAKNEAQFVDRWVKSMSEADYIVVLDTGSTDDTVEKLKQYDNVIVETKIISPWRFDIARNESLKLVPEDANILVCTDLDEILDPGWGDILRNNWIDGFHCRCYYKYAWSHDEEGNPGRIFWYDKIHDRNWKWIHPVHEFLVSDYTEEYIESHVLRMFDQIYLHHYPDQSKSRGDYLPLLELRRDESPDDYYGRFYLSHEYYYRGLYQQSINEISYLLENHINEFDTTELAACYMFLGDSYQSLGDNLQAIMCYHKAIEVDATFREPYLLIGEIYNSLGLHHMAIGVVQEGLAKSNRHYSWLERDSSWKEQPYDILSVAYFYIGDIEKAYCYSVKACNLNTQSERLNENKIMIENELTREC